MTERQFPTQNLSIRNDLNEIQRVGQMIESFVVQHGLPASLIAAFTLASDELLTNVISYGYDDEHEHNIHLQIKCDDSALRFRLEDDGRAYNPFATPTPDLTASLWDRPMGGLGIHLVRHLMDQVEYDREANKNIVLLTKQIPLQIGNETDEMH